MEQWASMVFKSKRLWSQTDKSLNTKFYHLLFRMQASYLTSLSLNFYIHKME